ncbi:unnamed protein product [Brachionus calyciflorus]|uniref:N-acetyltransferase domain-containing protein n=1 Tax=Brachionus calyciflorus TaxID=104777 RepID=A0A813QF53_9BILA|nr:unnamed protein product [Brachionus calyciflorus]
MEGHQNKIKNLLNKKAKKPLKKSKPTKPIQTTPINESQLIIRDMKSDDKYDLIKIVSDFRREYYISVYRKVFRSWFTYAVTGLLLAISLSLVSSKMFGLCLPPLIVTVYLIWNVNRYKRANQNFNINEMELLNQTETIYYKFKSLEQRRINQGVLVAFLKEEKSIDDIDLDDIDISDFNTDDSDIEEKLADKNKKLVAYLIYGKQKDELETVCIREICVQKDYRRRKIASLFVKKACLNLFKTYGYRRITFQVSNFNTEADKVCSKYMGLINKIYSWSAYTFVPGVCDERTIFAFSINDLKKF